MAYVYANVPASGPHPSYQFHEGLLPSCREKMLHNSTSTIPRPLAINTSFYHTTTQHYSPPHTSNTSNTSFHHTTTQHHSPPLTSNTPKMSPITNPTTTIPGALTFMSSIPDHGSPTIDQVFRIAIMVSTYPSNMTIEPLPHLDYYLINQLIALARPHLTKRDLKRMDYVADARRSFYQGHHKFQDAHRALIDAHACAEILDGRFEDLRRQFTDTLANEGIRAATLRRQLCALEIQRRSNNEDLRICLEQLRAKTERRQHTAAWFSNLKYVFLRDEMPWLTALGKQCYDRAMGQQSKCNPILLQSIHLVISGTIFQHWCVLEM